MRLNPYSFFQGSFPKMRNHLFRVLLLATLIEAFIAMPVAADIYSDTDM